MGSRATEVERGPHLRKVAGVPLDYVRTDQDRGQSGSACELRDVTNGSDLIIGTSEFAPSADAVGTRSFVEGRFTITGTTTLELQHQCQTTRADNGFGIESNFSVVEVYAVVRLWKVS